MPKNPADWLPKLFTKSEGTVREATTKKFSEFTKVNDGEGVQLVGVKGDSNVRVDVNDLTVDIPEVTTSTVMLETNDPLRNVKGQFMSTEGMDALNTQKDANRFLNEKITEAQDSVADVREALDGVSAQVQDGLEGQQDIQTDVGTLQNKVNALEGVVGDHSLIFTMDNSNPRVGEFNLKDGAMQVVNTIASADYITLSDTDRNGNAIDLDRIAEGDVLRFSSIDGQVAEIKVTDGTNGFFAFTKLSGELDRLSEIPYDFILLSSFDPAGLATVDYVDAQDALLATMINNNGRALNEKVSKSGDQNLDKNSAWKLKQQKQDGSNATFVSMNDGEMHLYHVVTPTAPTHAANMQYVDDQIAGVDLSDYLPLTGGTLTGEFKMKRTDDVSWWNYIRSEKPNAWDGGDSSKQQLHGLIIDIGATNTYKQQFKITGRNSKDLFLLSDDGKAQAEILGTLKAEEMLKDGKVVATEEYVDGKAGVVSERPMLWKYNPSVSANNLGNGEFNLSSSPTNASADEWSIYFSKRDANGQYWYPHDNGNEFTHEVADHMATIRGREQVCVHGKTVKWYFNQGTNNYARLKLSYYRSSNALGTGKYHLITIPGYMPYFTFSTDAQSNGTHS